MFRLFKDIFLAGKRAQSGGQQVRVGFLRNSNRIYTNPNTNRLMADFT